MEHGTRRHGAAAHRGQFVVTQRRQRQHAATHRTGSGPQPDHRANNKSKSKSKSKGPPRLPPQQPHDEHRYSAPTPASGGPSGSPDYIIQNLTANTKASTNRQFLQKLGQRRPGMSRRQISEQDSRMRQALLLLTGGCADADLFVQASTGRLKSTRQINAAIQDLMMSYRMHHGRVGAFAKQVWRKAEQMAQKSASVYHFGVVALALLSVIGAQRLVHRSLTKVSGLLKHDLKNGALKSTLMSLAAFAYPAAAGHTQADVFRLIMVNATDGITKWRSAQLVNAVFTDGLTAADLANMKHVARELVDLDVQVEGWRVNGEIPSSRLERALATFKRRSAQTVLHRLSFGSYVSNQDRLAQLFQYALQHPKAYTRTSFVREMIGTVGSTHVRGYHFLNSYGDRRRSVKDIMAAYLVVHEQNVASLRKWKTALIPRVASKSTIRSAKFRQRFVRASHSHKQRLGAVLSNIIRQHKVVLFSKTYCPYCQKAKALLREDIRSRQCHIIELDVAKNGIRIQKELQKMTQQSTVPNVFIHGKHVGGYDDLLRLRSTLASSHT